MTSAVPARYKRVPLSPQFDKSLNRLKPWRQPSSRPSGTVIERQYQRCEDAGSISTTGMSPFVFDCGLEDGKNVITRITPTENPKAIIASFDLIWLSPRVQSFRN
jgi:hypothetical protein